jgi:hypothetical protein
MPPASSSRRLFAAMVTLTAVVTCAPAGDMTSKNVSLNVRFTLTDLDYRPIAAAPVRVVFGSDPGCSIRRAAIRDAMRIDAR